MARQIVYRFNVTATLPLTEDPTHPDFYTEEAATGFHRRREVERAMFACLKRFEGDCDVELMDFSVEDE
jgi:hypothetical protein